MMEPERESVIALKSILAKVGPLVKPLGLSQDECTDLVQRMYESVLELDVLLAGESDDRRKHTLISHVRGAEISREDDRVVVTYPALPGGTAAKTPAPKKEAAEEQEPAPSLEPTPAPRPRRPRKSQPKPTTKSEKPTSSTDGAAAAQPSADAPEPADG
jgi:hypothetical protein